jgi:hypothetical protein
VAATVTVPAANQLKPTRPVGPREIVAAADGAAVHAGPSGEATALPNLSWPVTATASAAPTDKVGLPGEIDKLLTGPGTMVTMLAIGPSAPSAVMPGDPA